MLQLIALSFLIMGLPSSWAQDCLQGKKIDIPGSPQGFEIYRDSKLGAIWLKSKNYFLSSSAKAVELCPGSELASQMPKRIVVLSSTYLPWLADLGLISNVVGVTSKAFVASTDIHKAIDAGTIAEVGFPASSERVLALRPDLVITYRPVDEEIEGIDKLKSLGLKILELSEFDEQGPLARASWILFLAAAIGDKDAFEKSQLLWNERYQSYERFKKMAQTFPQVPVLVGSIGENSWSAPAGQSDLAQMIKDAGGSYLWNQEKSSSSITQQSIAFEKVLQDAKDAGVWLTQNQWTTRDQILKEDARYQLLGVYQRGEVYNYSKNKLPGAGFDYWETGIARPDLVLRDLILIFHQKHKKLIELFPNRNKRWYQKLE